MKKIKIIGLIFLVALVILLVVWSIFNKISQKKSELETVIQENQTSNFQSSEVKNSVQLEEVSGIVKEVNSGSILITTGQGRDISLKVPKSEEEVPVLEITEGDESDAVKNIGLFDISVGQEVRVLHNKQNGEFLRLEVLIRKKTAN